MDRTVDGAVEELLLYKGSLLKNSSKYRDHLNALLRELGIEDRVEAAALGAADAMVYDLACSLDFTKQKGQSSDWSSYERRKELLRKLWRR